VGETARGDQGRDYGDGGRGYRWSDFKMIDRARVLEILQDATPRRFASFGNGKPWQKSWLVLMGLLLADTADKFEVLRPKFRGAFKDFSVWMMEFKQDPRQHEAGPDSAYYFRDMEFGRAFNMLMSESDRTFGMRRPDDPQYDIRYDIWHLREKVGYYPKESK
jgi:hypothetical protein